MCACRAAEHPFVDRAVTGPKSIFESAYVLYTRRPHLYANVQAIVCTLNPNTTASALGMETCCKRDAAACTRRSPRYRRNLGGVMGNGCDVKQSGEPRGKNTQYATRPTTHLQDGTGGLSYKGLALLAVRSQHPKFAVYEDGHRRISTRHCYHRVSLSLRRLFGYAHLNAISA